MPGVKCRALLLCLLLAPLAGAAGDDDSGRVVERGQINDDFYAVGGVVDIDAVIDGDLVAAGGELVIGHEISGDLIAAGGRIEVGGRVDDDVRISGGEIDIDAKIGDGLAAAGGSIRLSPASRVGGDAWVTGGEIEIAGSIDGDLRLFGGEIRLSGSIAGDVEIDGGEIELLDGANIGGDLNYTSPQRAARADNVAIAGEVNYREGEPQYADRGFGLVFSITLIVTSILFYLLFPHYTIASVGRMRSDPFTSLGLGFVFVVATPIVAMALMLIILGFWIGLSVLALYCVALLCGFLIACFFVGERGAALFRQNLGSRARRLISVIVAIFVLGLVQTIPLLGGLLLLLLMLLGLGAGLIQLRYVYRPPGPAA